MCLCVRGCSGMRMGCPLLDNIGRWLEGSDRKLACTAEYHYPPHKPVSDACKDLLSKIFVVNPEQRITISGIWRHPWFREGMPADLDIDRYNDHYLRITMVHTPMPDRTALPLLSCGGSRSVQIVCFQASYT